MSLITKYERARMIARSLRVSTADVLVSYLLKRNLRVNLAGSTIHIPLSNAASLAELLSKNWEVTGLQGNLITLTNNHEKVSITCRTNKGWDLGHLVEIYLRKVYDYDVKDKVVIDAGASNGDSSIFFAKKGAKKVIALEPDEESFSLAIRNVEASGVKDRVVLLNQALASRKGKITFYVYENNVNGNSIDPENMVKLSQKLIPRTVDSVTLQDLLDMVKGETVGLLKMDCEGCEYSVLGSLDRNSFNRIEAITMEYHNGLQNLREILESNGFKVRVESSSGKMGYIDARRE
ncbi:hypothetical protein L3N51_02432 [Metallosphaera sp. J1]|uniref:FkbM family methyltransferase n=1 Tax=Metallosphaera javensis (ex Hofmann et al. 2022) TaxID=99938 RepID=UPI001EDD07DE|nr:FkbM family methyltransferase [Metallosphaera javensis (ex Hofmann et al. 2022)]MCG3110135.1 hypothetical protein [Metallosphaera javensis (ex Hofmann et al. 2022)]